MHNNKKPVSDKIAALQKLVKNVGSHATAEELKGLIGNNHKDQSHVGQLKSETKSIEFRDNSKIPHTVLESMKAAGMEIPGSSTLSTQKTPIAQDNKKSIPPNPMNGALLAALNNAASLKKTVTQSQHKEPTTAAKSPLQAQLEAAMATQQGPRDLSKFAHLEKKETNSSNIPINELQQKLNAKRNSIDNGLTKHYSNSSTGSSVSAHSNGLTKHDSNNSTGSSVSAHSNGSTPIKGRAASSTPLFSNGLKKSGASSSGKSELEQKFDAIKAKKGN